MMKYLHVSLMVIVMMMASGCYDDNSYDAKEGLIGSTKVSHKETFSSIQENILHVNATRVIDGCDVLLSDVISITSQEDLANAQESFKSLVRSMKAVEASYIAGDFNKSLIDTLRLVDIFHQGNEDIGEQLESIASSTSNVTSAMYKNSHKSINALEYMLFTYTEDDNKTFMQMQANSRRVEMLNVIVEAIQNHMLSVEAFYESSSDIQNDEEVTTDALLNVLIDSAYKLKEWRIGDPAGFTNKYKDSPDASRLEYKRSGYSAEAMISILTTHTQLMSADAEFDNFATYCISRGAKEEVDLINEHISKAMNLLESMRGTLANDLESDDMSELYRSVQALYSVYYTSLPAVFAQSGTGVNIAIIEADGD